MQEKRGISKLVIGLVLLFVGVGLLAWALSGRNADAPSGTDTTNTTENSPENTDATSETGAEGQNATTIAFTNTGFTPDTLTVKKGTVVTVRNESSMDVQFSSNEHPTHRDNPEMNLGTLRPGESASYTANTVGKWGFHDHIDASKTGSITVTE